MENPQLQLAFDFVQYTNRNVFLTGKAGTGKTTFLHNLKKISPKRMIVVAPTGVAAINAGGVTIHSFFQLAFGPQIPDEIQNKQQRFKFSINKINIIKSLDLLIIDEISMVRADMLDGIDEVLRRYKDHNEPFGGVQLLMIGDLQQLTPVAKESEWNLLKQYYETVFFFSSRALQKTSYISVELKHIYRQKDDAFIDILNKIRENSIDKSALNELNKRYKPGFSPNADEGYITLTTHNYQAQEINDSRLQKLPGKNHKFTAAVHDDFPEYLFPTQLELSLKRGAQVMFVKNDSSHEKLYYNGKIGTVSGFEEDIIYVKCQNDDFVISVKTVEWYNTKYSLNEETKEIEEIIAGTFIQYPLKLAWAITIHKSQGLTFDKAIIDANAAFTHGQVYVAISRCRTLEGLILSTPISNRCIISNSTVLGFTHDIEQNQPDKNLLNDSKLAYQKMLLFELFDFSLIQLRINCCAKLFYENKKILLGNLSDNFITINEAIKKDIVNVSGKFNIQLSQLISQNNCIEENVLLQERVKSACPYFTGKIEAIIIDALNNTTIETDNKNVAKLVKEAMQRAFSDTTIKISCLKACMQGFYVKKYLETKAKAVIEKPEAKPATQTMPDERISDEIIHPVLNYRLKDWRKSTAEELDMPFYMVLPQKTILELINHLPVSLIELKKIKGLGKKKINKFGSEILHIISSYCKENNINNHEHKISDSVKTDLENKNTKQVSFDLLKSGKTIKEIAVERGFTASTIEGHIAHFVGTGELDILQFVTPEKKTLISDYFINNGNYILGQAKAALGENVSYGELRFVLQHLEFIKKAKRGP